MEKLVATEEHISTADIYAAWETAPDAERDLDRSNDALRDQVLDLGEGRLAGMRAQGTDVQVLSVTSPGVQNLDAEIAVPLARAADDAIAAAMRAHPDRFEGFATLATPDPSAAADELRRAVSELGFKGGLFNGRTRWMNIDHPEMDPLWSAAADLRCPIYIHPQLPATAVRDAVYSGFGALPDWILGGPMIGWHYETGIQALRLVLSGAFDRYPDLQIIIGHWGELVLFYVERIMEMHNRVKVPALQRPIVDYFRENISYSGSGILSDRYLRWTKEMVGAQRILHGTDYPFLDHSHGEARRFLQDADLTEDEREDIAHRNWERLTSHLG